MLGTQCHNVIILPPIQIRPNKEMKITIFFLHVLDASFTKLCPQRLGQRFGNKVFHIPKAPNSLDFFGLQNI